MKNVSDEYFSSFGSINEDLSEEDAVEQIVEEAIEEPVVEEEIIEEALVEEKPKRSRKTKTTKVEKVEDPVVATEVALYSSGNLHHPVYGRLKKGYNIVSSSNAKEWLALSSKVREATPEEVATAYGA